MMKKWRIWLGVIVLVICQSQLIGQIRVSMRAGLNANYLLNQNMRESGGLQQGKNTLTQSAGVGFAFSLMEGHMIEIGYMAQDFEKNFQGFAEDTTGRGAFYNSHIRMETQNIPFVYKFANEHGFYGEIGGNLVRFKKAYHEIDMDSQHEASVRTNDVFTTYSDMNYGVILGTGIDLDVSYNLFIHTGIRMNVGLNDIRGVDALGRDLNFIEDDADYPYSEYTPTRFAVFSLTFGIGVKLGGMD